MDCRNYGSCGRRDTGAFYLEFRSEPIQHDSGAWANFATYFSGIFNAYVALINLVALLLIAVVVTDQQQNALASKRLALDMLAQWNGAELYESRRVISDLIEDTPEPTQLPTLREMERSRPTLHFTPSVYITSLSSGPSSNQWAK